jgi:hypothetical protein
MMFMISLRLKISTLCIQESFSLKKPSENKYTLDMNRFPRFFLQRSQFCLFLAYLIISFVTPFYHMHHHGPGKDGHEGVLSHPQLAHLEDSHGPGAAHEAELAARHRHVSHLHLNADFARAGRAFEKMGKDRAGLYTARNDTTVADLPTRLLSAHTTSGPLRDMPRRMSGRSPPDYHLLS